MFAFEYELPSEAGPMSLEGRKAFLDAYQDEVCVHFIEALNEDGETFSPIEPSLDEIRWAKQAWNKHQDAVHDYGC